MNPTRTLMIVCRGPNDFDVHEGERYASRLTWDEMLGQVAELTHSGIKRARYGMYTMEEQMKIHPWMFESAAERAARNARLAEGSGDAEAAIEARAAAWRAEQNQEGK